MPIVLPKYCRASHIGNAPKVVAVALNVASMLCCSVALVVVVVVVVVVVPMHG